MIKKKLFAILLLLFGICSLFCCGKERAFTLGFIANLEGVNSKVGIDAYRSVKLAYEEYLESGDSNFKLKLVSIDSNRGAGQRFVAYEKIKDRCDFIIHVTNSTTFLAMYDRLILSDKLQITNATTTAISKKDDNVIRNVPDTETEQKNIADFFNRRKIKKLLIVRESKSNPQYTDIALKYFKEYYRGHAVETKFSATTMNLKDSLKKIKTGTFKYVYILADEPLDAGRIVQNFAMIQKNVNFFVLPWTMSPLLIESCGRYSDRITVFGHRSLKNTDYKKYIEKFKIKYKRDPDSQAPLAYDASKILLEAVHNNADISAASLKRYIQSHSYQLTSGKIIFNKFGDIDGKLYIYRVKGNEFILQE